MKNMRRVVLDRRPPPEMYKMYHEKGSFEQGVFCQREQTLAALGVPELASVSGIGTVAKHRLPTQSLFQEVQHWHLERLAIIRRQDIAWN